MEEIKDTIGENILDYSKKIDKIWEQTIGDAKKGLRQAMKEVCEKQCTNKDSECCYMP
jgi:hypothetical protein